MNIKGHLTAIFLVISLTVGSEGCGLFIPATYDVTEYLSIHQAALDGDLDKLKKAIKTNPEIVNSSDYDKNTPLHLAAIHDHVEAVKFLLENGANIDAQNSSDMTPLHLAAKQGFINVVTVLLSRNPNLNAKDSRG